MCRAVGFVGRSGGPSRSGPAGLTCSSLSYHFLDSHTMESRCDCRFQGHEMKTALLLIAHGSRNAAANDDLFALAEDLHHARVYAAVEASFLELAEPTIDAAVRR